jgi:LmbE family N-acetylglucosaminyl deacetylase
MMQPAEPANAAYRAPRSGRFAALCPSKKESSMRPWMLLLALALVAGCSSDASAATVGPDLSGGAGEGTVELATLIEGRKVLVVLSHPDDEIYILGTLSRLSKSGYKVNVVYVTSGMHGRDIRGVLRSGTHELAQKREQETLNALMAVGVPNSQVEFLRLDDAANDLAKIEDVLRPRINDRNPDVLITFGPDGAYGHQDHRYTSVAATEVSSAATVRRPPVVLHSCVSKSRNEAAGGQLLSANQGNTPIHDDAVNLRVPVTGELAVIKEALASYESQFRSEHIVSVFERSVAKYGFEDFILARSKTRMVLGEK